MMAILFLLVVGSLVFVGLRQLRAGLRGTIIDENPYCNACGFDLAGLPDATPCPECGDGGRRIGTRRRGPRRAALGAILVLLGSVVSLGAIAPRATFGLFRTAAPLWLVRWEAQTGSNDAVIELDRRVGGGALSSKQISAVVDDAMATRHRWDGVTRRTLWGEVLDDALRTNRLAPEVARQCIEGAVGVEWNGTSELFKAGQAGVLFVFRACVGSNSAITYNATIASALLGDQPLAIETPETGVHYAHVHNSAPGDTFIQILYPGQWAGKTLTVTWRVRYLDAVTGAPIGSDWDHTETIRIPATGDGFWHGRRGRETKPPFPP